MKSLNTILLSFGVTWQATSQNLIRDYKKFADKSLLQYFDATVLSKIKCDRFTTYDKYGSDRFIYNENKNKRLPFSSISFTYSLFDKVLNDDIYFYISVNKSHQVIIDSSIFKRIPLCIRTSQSCNFISSDSAKQIAVTDSIKFANDLSYQLERNKVDKEYYWIITGHRPSDRPKTNKSSLNRYAETISTDQRRIINAQTGLIIPYEEFDYDW